MPTKKLVDTSVEKRGRKGTPAPTGVLFSIAVSVVDGDGREAGAGGSAHRGTPSSAHARNPPRKPRGRNFTTVQQREVWPRRFTDPSHPRFSDPPGTGKSYLMTIPHHACPAPAPAAAAPGPRSPGEAAPAPEGRLRTKHRAHPPRTKHSVTTSQQGPGAKRAPTSSTAAGAAAKRSEAAAARHGPLRPAPPGPRRLPRCPDTSLSPPRSPQRPPGGAPERRREPPGPAPPRCGRRCRHRLPGAAAPGARPREARSDPGWPRRSGGSGRGGAGTACPPEPAAFLPPHVTRPGAGAHPAARPRPCGRGQPREESGHGRRAELPGCGHRGVAGPGAGQFGIHSLMLTNSPWTRQGTNWATALFWILISFIIRNPVSFQIKCNLETLAPHAEIFFFLHPSCVTVLTVSISADQHWPANHTATQSPCHSSMECLSWEKQQPLVHSALTMPLS